MKHTIQTLAWALLVGHALTASAQAPLQREEAVALALEQNLGVQIARLNVEQAKSTMRGAAEPCRKSG